MTAELWRRDPGGKRVSAHAPQRPVPRRGVPVGIPVRSVLRMLVCLAVLVSGRTTVPGAVAAESAREAGLAASGGGLAVGPGEYEFTVAGNRRYLLHVPRTYDASRPAPLVLFFHGGGGNMRQAARAYGWREKSEEAGFVVAFPNGTSRLPGQRLATWNAGRCCGYARDAGIDDVAFTRRLVADVERRVRVDRQRVFATGMSNGGMMVHRLACEMADTFAAVAAVAGTDNTTACHPSRPVSVMHVHARDDTHVLFDGGAGRDAFRDRTKVTDFTSVRETIERWVARDYADRTAQRVLDVRGAHADLYTSSRDHAQVELVVTDTGGHSWPGARPRRGRAPSRAIVANDVIWDFFARQGR